MQSQLVERSCADSRDAAFLGRVDSRNQKLVGCATGARIDRARSDVGSHPAGRIDAKDAIRFVDRQTRILRPDDVQVGADQPDGPLQEFGITEYDGHTVVGQLWIGADASHDFRADACNISHRQRNTGWIHNDLPCRSTGPVLQRYDTASKHSACASGCPRRSLSERIGSSSPGQSIPMSGSFQSKVRSCSGA